MSLDKLLINVSLAYLHWLIFFLVCLGVSMKGIVCYWIGVHSECGLTFLLVDTVFWMLYDDDVVSIYSNNDYGDD